MKQRLIYLSLSLVLLAVGAALLFSGSGSGIFPEDDLAGPTRGRTLAAFAAPAAAVTEPIPDSIRGGQNVLPQPAVTKPHPRLEASLDEVADTFASDGEAEAAELAAARGLELKDGRVTVVLETDGTPAAAAAVAAGGGDIQAIHENLLQAAVPVAGLEGLAEASGVTYIRPPETPALFALSEGVADIGAPAWQAQGVDGAGVKIAVLDPGFYGYDQRIAAGDLPANVITRSFRTDGDITGGGEKHGTGCAEIVYDIAPGGQLYLVNFSTDVELGNAIDYLASEGIQVVSASWGFFSTFRGDGQGSINDMTATARQAGIFWANSAGNAAQTHWSGSFADADSDGWTEFSGSSEANTVSVSAGQRIDIYLTWDKWPVTDQDYDLYLYQASQPGAPVAASDAWQHGGEAPAEEIHYVVPPGQGGTYQIAINAYFTNGDATFNLYTYPNSLQYQVPTGSLGGQPSDSPHVLSVGAVAAGTTSLESFSSRGPTTDGRLKPDVVAPDRVTTAAYGSQGFWGTSASAPHAAGAAALVRGAYPAYDPAAAQSFLESRATDLGAAGKDSLYGSGALNLGAAPDASPPVVSGVLPAGDVIASPASISASFSDGDSGVNPASATLTLDSSPLAGCTATAAQISCPAPALTAGSHVIGGSVSDNASNAAAIAGSFTYHCGQPEIDASILQTFWGSYADYQASLLAAAWSFCNAGANEAVGMTLVGSINSNSVMLANDLPAAVGNITAGACQSMTLTYMVPPGVSSFRSSTYATCSDACGGVYTYPGPFPGA